jgi:muramoyltetrapeptide carboxypeptidase
MDRRKFSKKIAFGLGASALLPNCTQAQPTEKDTLEASAKQNTTSGLLKPRRLKKGDTIGLITPGSFIPDKALEKAVRNVEQLGFKVKLGKYIRALRGFNAGTDEQRLEDLHAMFTDPAVDGIWCARGGYGCTRLLPMIDFDLVKKHPKVFLGYSDITALHNAFYQRCGLVTFHGPVASSTMTPYAIAHFRRALMEENTRQVITPAGANKKIQDELYQPKKIRGGVVRGVLIGGNLSLLAAMAGTEFAIDPADKIVFMEDIEEKPYRIDRMLTQLRQSDQLATAAGFALGIFADCVPEPEDRSLSLLETIQDRLYELGKPVAYGLSWGHISNQATLPVGVQAELDADKMQLILLESGVV